MSPHNDKIRNQVYRRVPRVRIPPFPPNLNLVIRYNDGQQKSPVILVFFAFS